MALRGERCHQAACAAFDVLRPGFLSLLRSLPAGFLHTPLGLRWNRRTLRETESNGAPLRHFRVPSGWSIPFLAVGGEKQLWRAGFFSLASQKAVGFRRSQGWELSPQWLLLREHI